MYLWMHVSGVKLGIYKDRDSFHEEGHTFWSGHYDNFSVSNRICNHFFVCIFFVFIYVSILICNDCRVAMHFSAPCIIVLKSISVRSVA